MYSTLLTLQSPVPFQAMGQFGNLTVVLCCLGSFAVSGCEQNPLLVGNPPANPPVVAMAPPGRPAGDAAADTAVDAPIPKENLGIQVIQPDASRPAAKTGLVRGLTQLLNSTPLEDEQKGSIRDQMEEADNILSNVKRQNKDAMREAFRQQRLRGAGSPNIVMIIADDLCLSDLSCYGPSEILTPNIDRLAKSGVRFTQAYAASPVSQDARWCLVAGPRPDSATVRFQDSAALQSSDVTMAEVMWQAGYTPGVYGPWGVMGANGPADPEGNGYLQWLGTYGPADEPQPYPEFVSQAGTQLRLLKNADGKQGQYGQDFFTSEAAAFLSRNIHQRPVFLQYFFSVPGTRRTVPKLDNYADKPWPDSVKIRAAAITRMDNDIGKLIQRLQDLKQLSNTVVIITSDTAGDPAEVPVSSADGQIALRGRHGDLYEGGLRVPLIISGTGAIPAGKSIPAVAATWDLAPTIYQLTHVARMPQIKTGQSLLPHLKPNAPMPVRFLKWEPQNGTAGLAVRWKDWKAIRLPGSSQFVLYDLKTDPTETKDVAGEHVDVLAEIQAKLLPQTSKVAVTPH
ncbi:MAG: arylsulfatase family protein [Planctomycetaceae bacterium]|nr:arylsulfatase family protein [Planctomycetaceae bacterium]